MEKREDTPQRIIRRRYEEKHSAERKENNKVWGTSIPRDLAEEIDKFLRQNNISKVVLIYAGYEALKRKEVAENRV